MKFRLFYILFVLTSFFSSFAVFANNSRNEFIKTSFLKVNEASKGALGPNMYQTPEGRVLVFSNGKLINPPKDTLITAAFRTELADALAAQDFYVGNRFSTNYWTLHNKYLATQAEKSALAFRFQHSEFMKLQAPALVVDAQSMARHMILEKFYMSKFPSARLTQANLQRGTADANHEKKFYGLLIEFLAQKMSRAEDYLVLFETQKRFNLTGDSNEVSLSRLRDDVASIFSRMEAESFSGGKLSQFRDIRNSIHNFMTPDVLPMITKYMERYRKDLSASFAERILKLQQMIAQYYDVNKKVLTQKLNFLSEENRREAQTVLANLRDRGNRPEALEHLSRFLTKIKEQFLNSNIRRVDEIHWMISAQQFIQNELAQLGKDADLRSRARVSIDSVYAGGLISRQEWLKAHEMLQRPLDVNLLPELVTTLEDLLVKSHQISDRAFQPALADWKLVESSMEGLLDDILRASLLSDLNQTILAIKELLPKKAEHYSIENAGTAFGYLVYVPAGATSKQIALLDRTMIPIFAELPLDLSVVAGIITEQPQTPLSHVSIKSKARGTANLYFKNASKDQTFAPFLSQKPLEKGKLIRLALVNGEISVRPATLEEAQAAWTGALPNQGNVKIHSDLNEKRIRSTRELGFRDVISVGAKAANYGEASRAVPAGIFQDAFGLPFVYYKQFIETNKYDDKITLAEKIRQVVQDPRSKTDRQFLVSSLEDIQSKMVGPDAVVDPDLIKSLELVLNQAYPNTRMRFRSSTNSEDLPNFSGAGLYDSYTYRPGHETRTIANSLKRVWASVWNVRAYDEREHFGIPHLDVYMGILISPSFPNETANGVAVTQNTVQPQLGAGVYLNTQIGEEAVTNPNPAITPEELIVQVPSWNLNYLKFSSIPDAKNSAIMTDQEAKLLAQYFWMIHLHFKAIHDPQNQNPDFSMDMEFKIDTRNGVRSIFIKQARPYVTKSN